MEKKTDAVSLFKQEFLYLCKILELSKKLMEGFQQSCFTSIFLIFTFSLTLGFSQMLMCGA